MPDIAPQDAVRGEDAYLLLFRDGTLVGRLDLNNFSVTQEANLRLRKVCGSREGKVVVDNNGWSGSATIDMTGFEMHDLIDELSRQYFDGDAVEEMQIVHTINLPSGLSKSWLYAAVMVKMDESGTPDQEYQHTFQWQTGSPRTALGL